MAAVFFVPLYLISEGIIPVELPQWALIALFLIPYLTVGYDILRKAALGIRNRQVFDENFLMAVATIGAIALGEYGEGVAVMLLYQVGELFQSVAVGKSRRNISQLMDIRPDYANIEGGRRAGAGGPGRGGDGQHHRGAARGEGAHRRRDRGGRSALNTSALTGESLPRDVARDDEVLSGCINETGVLKVRTTTEFDESTASKILDLVENAASRKSKSENFITKFARVYTPAVCYSALALAVLPPLSGADHLLAGGIPTARWGQTGSTAPAPSWSSAAPARWSSASR